MRFHLLSLPHTQVTADYLTCAYTQKVRKFCQMMAGHHEVYLYAGEECDVPATEHIVCMPEERRRHWFGEGFDTVETPLEWDENEPYWRLFNTTASIEIGERVQKGDLILLTTSIQKSVAEDHIAKTIGVEWAVGYEGVRTDRAIFESYAWMHHVYGLQERRMGRAYDAVVPNFFNPQDFAIGPKEDWLLYVGRLIANKGVHVAAQIAERLERKLVVAGPGALEGASTHLIATDGTKIENKAGIEYMGVVGMEERADLMSKASCLLVPTLYVEPFGGVAVEAMLSGTPVVASDWGAFTETVTPDVGRRFRTLQEGADAVVFATGLDSFKIRRSAEKRFSLSAVRPQFERTFRRIDTLWGEGWSS